MIKIFFKIWSVVLIYLYVLGFYTEHVISRPLANELQIIITMVMMFVTVLAIKLVIKFLKPKTK